MTQAEIDAMSHKECEEYLALRKKYEGKTIVKTGNPAVYRVLGEEDQQQELQE